MREQQKTDLLMAKLSLVSDELSEARAKLSQYESEFHGVRQQESLVRMLEDQIKEYEAKMAERVASAVDERQKQLLEEVQEAKQRFVDQEAALRAQIIQLRTSLTEAQNAHDVTKSQVFELTAKVERSEAAKDAGISMLTEDLERAQAQISSLQKDKEELKHSLAVATSEDLRASRASAAELEMAEELSRVKAALQQSEETFRIDSARWDTERSELYERVESAEGKLKEYETTISTLRQQLSELPSMESFQKLKRQLYILQEAEFSVEDPEDDSQDPESSGANPLNSSSFTHVTRSKVQSFELSDVEQVLVQRTKRLESQLTNAKNTLVDKTKEALALQAQVQSMEESNTELKNLVQKLEEDLSATYGSQGVPSLATTRVLPPVLSPPPLPANSPMDHSSPPRPVPTHLLPCSQP